MKKILFVAVCCLLALSANAQTRVGIKAGWVNDNLQSKNAEATASTGFEAGLLLNAPLGYGFSIQPELLYSQKAAETNAALGGLLKNNNTYTTSNIEIPINFQWGYQFDEDLNLRPFIMAGPYFDYAIGRSLKSTTSVVGVTGSETLKGDDLDKDVYKPFDWGFNFGIGVDVWKLQFAVRYNLGMGNVIDVDDTDYNSHFRGWNISLGFLF